METNDHPPIGAPIGMLMVLTTMGEILTTKLIFKSSTSGITISHYDLAKHFSGEKRSFWDFEGYCELRFEQIEQRHSFEIRGEPVPGLNLKRFIRRLHDDHDTGEKKTFVEKAHRHLLLDIDSLEKEGIDSLDGPAAAEAIRDQDLPSCFQGVSCFWSHTSSAGFKPDIRLRLGFVLSRPLGQRHLDQLFCASPVDCSLFRPVQPNYPAAPVFCDGIRDPVAGRRFGVLRGERDIVVPPKITFQRPKPEQRHVSMLLRRDGTPAGQIVEHVATLVAKTSEAGANAWGGTGRHHSLFCAALRLSGLIGAGKVAEGDVKQVLHAAANACGLADDREIARTIKNGLRTGGVR